jgi:hypothetical protein
MARKRTIASSCVGASATSWRKQAGAFGQDGEDDLDGVAHACPDRRAVVDLDLLDRLRRQAAKGRRQQRGRRHPVQRIGLERSERLFGAGASRQAAIGAPHERLHRASRVLERLALEEAGEQQVAFLEAQELFVELDLLQRREEPASLQVDGRRRDEEELGRDVEVELSMPSSSPRYSSTIRERISLSRPPA